MADVPDKLLSELHVQYIQSLDQVRTLSLPPPLPPARLALTLDTQIEPR